MGAPSRAALPRCGAAVALIFRPKHDGQKLTTRGRRFQRQLLLLVVLVRWR